MGGFVRRIIKAPSKIIRKVLKPPAVQVQKAAVKAAPKGPTKAEMIDKRARDMTNQEMLIANKRKGRKALQLTGNEGIGLEDVNYLSKKSMLG